MAICGRARASALLSVLLLAGCATLPEGSERSDKDPWEGYNRAVYRFNDAIDEAVLRPAAQGYRAITPDPVEHGISNFFSNLGYPVVILNQFLQGDFADGARDTGRFLLNSVIGLGGIFDPASSLGLESHNEDFGQTLAVWGVPSGPFLMLPFLGPSTVRDGVGTYADAQVNPLYRKIERPERYWLIGLQVIDLRAQLLDVDSQLKNAYDPYAFMRDAYLQRREYLVNDGSLPQDQDYYDDLYEDFEDFEDFEEPAADDGDNSGREPDAPPAGEDGGAEDRPG